MNLVYHGLYRLQHCEDAHKLALLLSLAECRRWYVQRREVSGSGHSEWFIITSEQVTNRDPIVQSVTQWENGVKLPLDEDKA